MIYWLRLLVDVVIDWFKVCGLNMVVVDFGCGMVFFLNVLYLCLLMFVQCFNK